MCEEVEMPEFKQILCPVDFSDPSRFALEHAVVIAGWYGSTLTVLHVCDPVYPAEPPLLLAEFPTRTGTLGDADRQELEARLEPWLASARAKRLSTSIVFDEGHNPAAPILACATLLPADLIVMGTHGLGGLDRLLLGSVTEKVLRKAQCPVLSVPPRAFGPATPVFKRVLCPVDFSESSTMALQVAFSLAEESDAQLTVLHVLDWPVEDELITQRLDAPEFRLPFETSVKQRLDALITTEAHTWAAPATEVTHGKAYRRILEIAARDKTDLIVMGVRGRNPLDLMLFGSTTNHVVRQASCPVLTLRQ
jgi:nucleotide-binding universal stress UspA family protein